MFKDEEGVQIVKAKANREYIERHSARAQGQSTDFFLSVDEEEDVAHYFSLKMGEFCNNFKPPMPKYVKGTAFHYFKRFYLNNSVMDYHPKEILVTAVYLACKVEEFNVSMSQFVANVLGDQERATKIILNNELLLMQELQFHLTIHNPFRAVEGLIIDIKTRYQPAGEDIEDWRHHIDKFLDSVFLTNAIMIYSPSQLALAAIIHAASRHKSNVDNYVTSQLFGGQPQEAIGHIISCVRNIRLMVKNLPEGPEVSNIKSLCGRLEKCRNQDNNPDSAAYKRKIEASVDEEDMINADHIPVKQARLDTGDLVGVKALSPGGG